jgi:phosphatidylserine/phosphatidylglycerophosphate/cardiolipin synthase-like enzyme
MRHLLATLLLAPFLVTFTPAPAHAQLERLCDPGNEDCRQLLITHIRAEKVGLDVAFWFMEDAWIASEIINRHKAGVPVRVLVDTEANASTPRNADRLAELKAAGIPMREKVSSGILHWKMMLFAGQGIVEFSGANFSSDAWLYSGAPYTNYVDEAIYFTGDASVVNSFRTKYDDLWIDTTRYANYANITRPLWRAYANYPKDPELNFPPLESFAARSVDHYDAETRQLDVIIYRITDQRHTNAVIAAANRGVPVRLITEPQQYRDPKRLWHSWNIDRLYMAGVQIRDRVHAGLNHQKLTLYHGQGISVLGSSNWTSPSDNSQEEHNYFTRKPELFNWLTAHFDRKWTNATGIAETGPFTPLPPDAASSPAPADASLTTGTTGIVLKWHAGFWAHKYDIYFGTSPNPPLLAADQMLGPSQSTVDYRQFPLPLTLDPGTTYYWRIVSKTMADKAATSTVWSFTTPAGTAPPPPPPPPSPSLPSPWTSQDVGVVGPAGSASLTGSTFTVKASGADIWGTADGLHYVSQPVTGDVDIVARVATVENVHQWTKAGVMIRGSLAADAAQGMMLVSPGKGLAYQRRLAKGGESVSTAGGAGMAPAWVKLERRGNTLRAFRSADGVTWTLVGTDSFALPSTALVGLALTSHDNTRLATATFDNVTITAAQAPPPPAPDTQAPTARITSPAAGAAVSGTVNVAVDATDNVAVARVEILLNGVVVATDTAAPYQFAWDTRTGANGVYSLQARAVDAAGNVGTSTAVQVTVGNSSVSSQEIVLWAGDATKTAGAWRLVADATAAGGQRMHHPDAGGAKLTTALASPTNYFELTFEAVAGKAYRIWMRGKADGNYWPNDSVFMQFSGAVDGAGAAIWRIGTTSAAEYNLEECSGCGVAGWGWQDNGWGQGVMGPLVYFKTSGPQTIRIQTREDGLSLDQIVLSPVTYLNASPGPNKNDATILGKTQ